jgi:hypothetical protein
MNPETLNNLVQGHQQRVYEICQRESELAWRSSNAEKGSVRRLQKLADWLRPTYPSIGFIQLSDLED